MTGRAATKCNKWWRRRCFISDDRRRRLRRSSLCRINRTPLWQSTTSTLVCDTVPFILVLNLGGVVDQLPLDWPSHLCANGRWHCRGARACPLCQMTQFAPSVLSLHHSAFPVNPVFIVLFINVHVCAYFKCTDDYFV